MAQIISQVIEQHAEEAAFLWLLRDDAVRAPHYTLGELAALDQRVEAHIDGLRIAGEEGWNAAKEQLRWKEAGEIFAGTSVAIHITDTAPYEEIREIGTSEPELLRGFISAFGWTEYEKVQPRIEELLKSERSADRHAGIAASAIHRHDPGEALEKALTDSDPALRARALQAVGELGRLDLLDRMRPALSDTDDACRFAAAWAVSLHREEPGAINVLKSFADASGPFTRQAAATWLRKATLPEANGWREALSEDRALLSAICAGVLGDPKAIPWLIEQMNSSALARRAGEAITMITGADIEELELHADPPEGFESGPTENPEEQDVSIDPDSDLPWLDPEKISAWWKTNASSFREGVRHLHGKPISLETSRETLSNGRQRARAAAAVELVIQEPGKSLVEVRAPGYRQG